MAALFSCAAGQLSHETVKLGGGHGIFFHYVLEGLRGKARTHDDDVTWDDLTVYVKRQVPRAALEVIGEGAQQSPHLVANLAGESPVLRRLPRVVKKDSPPVEEKDTPAPKKEVVKKEEKPPASESPPAESKPTPPTEGEVARLVKLLKDAKTRARAASEIGKLGSAGRSAARHLCEALVDSPTPELRQTLLDALESVHPAIHKHVFTLLIDGNNLNHIKASSALAALKSDGKPTTPILLAHARWCLVYLREAAGLTVTRRKESGDPPPRPFGISDPVGDVLIADLTALAAVGGGEPETLNLLEEAAAENRLWNIPPAAVQGIGRVAKEHPIRRKKAVEVLIRVLDAKPVVGPPDVSVILTAISGLGDLRAGGKEAIPALRKLKLHPDEKVRDAARAALSRIEGKE
jgi:hypothetical protein